MWCLTSLQIAGRGEGHIDFEGFRKIYDAIMAVKEVIKIAWKKRNSKNKKQTNKTKLKEKANIHVLVLWWYKTWFCLLYFVISNLTMQQMLFQNVEFLPFFSSSHVPEPHLVFTRVASVFWHYQTSVIWMHHWIFTFNLTINIIAKMCRFLSLC